MSSAATYPAYPARMEARMDQPLSRWLWLVKWFLVIPHVIVLFFRWAAFVVLSVVAFVAILCTGRYPRGIFDFNVGVLRWTWQVRYYFVVAIFLGGAWPTTSQAGGAGSAGASWPGLITLLVLIGAVALLFTGQYPPFRLDMGERESGELEPGGA